MSEELLAAVKEEDLGKARSLLQRGIRNDQAFIRAVNMGNLEMVKMFLSHGANIHLGDDAAIFSACLFGYVEIFRLLLQHGANLCQQLLPCASKGGHVEIIKILLHTNGFSFSAKTIFASSILVIRSNNITVLGLLLEQGSFPNDKIAALMSAVLEYGTVEMKDLLIEHGGDPNQTRDPEFAQKYPGIQALLGPDSCRVQ